MLISLSITNFRSFYEEQTLSMVASQRQPDHPDHLSTIEALGQKLLPVAVIYGANGSGKSNLVKSLSFVQRLVIQGVQPGQPIGRQRFLFGTTDANEPSAFEVRFTAEDRSFNYGFKVTDKEVLEEWLDLLTSSGEINLFERVTRPDGTVTVEAGDAMTGDGFGDQKKVVALTKVGVRANQLFLAGIRETLEKTGQGPLIASVLSWFASIVVVSANASFGKLAEWVAKDSKFADFAGEFLRDSSTGVDRLRVETTELADSSAGLPPEFLHKIMEDAKPGEVRTIPFGSVGEILVERGEGNKLLIRTIRAEHISTDGKPVPLPFQEESDGTQRLTHLLPALFQLKEEHRLYIIDEIDRSLHPLLSRKFIEFFLKVCKEHGSQIIITTHESNLMDLELLRRDELWFTEKNPQGATTIYSMSDFKVRTDLKIEKGYLHGRFGAIPFLGNLDRLIEQLNSEAPCR
jgi:AAA15 family ATPase/GTPase